VWLLVQVFGEDELADRLLARLLDQQFVDLGLTLLAQLFPVHQGLDPNKTYKVEEINLMPGVDSALKSNGQTYTGDYLMKVGIEVFGFAATQSHVLELTAM
jgi:hypothetical protein